MTVGALTLSTAAPAHAQSPGLTLAAAIDAALENRPSLKAAAEQIAAAEALRRQAGARANAQFELSTENVRVGEPYAPDADTMAIVTQPLDLVGRRSARITLADEAIAASRVDLDAERLAVARTVTNAYWAAQEAQQAQRVLDEAVSTFQQVIDYHAAQLQAGTIPEQDLLRVRLEGERIRITAGLAALDASKTRIELTRLTGRPIGTTPLVDALDMEPRPIADISEAEVIRRNPAVLRGERAVTGAQAAVSVQRADGRPDLAAIVGYKRTALADANTPSNTLVAGLRISVPWADRNTGNRLAAEAELRRRQALLQGTESDVLAAYRMALDEYIMRRGQISEVVRPLREHAASVAQIAQAAYQQGGLELLRLLDARRAQLDADLAWVHAMAEWQRSAAAVRFAAGDIR